MLSLICRGGKIRAQTCVQTDIFKLGRNPKLVTWKCIFRVYDCVKGVAREWTLGLPFLLNSVCSSPLCHFIQTLPASTSTTLKSSYAHSCQSDETDNVSANQAGHPSGLQASLAWATLSPCVCVNAILKRGFVHKSSQHLEYGTACFGVTRTALKKSINSSMKRITDHGEREIQRASEQRAVWQCDHV